MQCKHRRFLHQEQEVMLIKNGDFAIGLRNCGCTPWRVINQSHFPEYIICGQLS